MSQFSGHLHHSTTDRGHGKDSSHGGDGGYSMAETAADFTVNQLLAPGARMRYSW